MSAFTTKLAEASAREHMAAQAVAEYARHLIITLKDRGAPAAADELARLLYVYDCEKAQTMALITEYPLEYFEVVSSGMRKMDGT